MKKNIKQQIILYNKSLTYYKPVRPKQNITIEENNALIHKSLNSNYVK